MSGPTQPPQLKKRCITAYLLINCRMQPPVKIQRFPAATNARSFPCSFVRAASRHSRSSRTPRRRRASAHCFRLPSDGAAFRSLYARLHAACRRQTEAKTPSFGTERVWATTIPAKSLIAVAGFARESVFRV